MYANFGTLEEQRMLWSKYKPYGDVDDRNRIVLHYLTLADIVSKHIITRLPSQIQYLDIRSMAIMGLYDAIDKYDPDRGPVFSSYGRHRINGSVIDELRRSDFASRRDRRYRRLIEATELSLTAELGRMPLPYELAQRTGLSEHMLRSIRTSGLGVLSLDEVYDFKPALIERLADEGPTPEEQFMRGEDLRVLHQALHLLPQRLRYLAIEYFWCGRTLADIGKDLGVSESRVGQMKAEMMRSLRRTMLKLSA